MGVTRVISLDLDDTLWPVAPVLAAAEAALHEVAQHERNPNHHHARGRHQTGGYGHDAGAVRHARRTDVTDEPIRCRNRQRK